jgi:fermentation-respiration switch protein FrsA (DUF1100 family)
VSLILIDRFESQKHVVNVKCPILQIHGHRDQVVPLKLGQKLFEAAPAKSATGIAKQQVLLPRADHNDVYSADLGIVMESLQNFLDEVRQHAEKK